VEKTVMYCGVLLIKHQYSSGTLAQVKRTPPTHSTSKNVLSLTDKGEIYNELVVKQHMSGNLDSPEGGFDVIRQVAICRVSAFVFYKGPVWLFLWILSAVLPKVTKNMTLINKSLGCV
jgi:hypothetical protein